MQQLLKKDFSIYQQLRTVFLQSRLLFLYGIMQNLKNACPLLLAKLILMNVDKDF